MFLGHLAEPLPDELRGRFDVVIAVVPYVPTEELAYLPRDVREFEPLLALDGGPGGTRLLEQAVWAGARLLRSGGALLLEVGGEQDEALREVLGAAGFGALRRQEDDEGDLRGLEARLRQSTGAAIGQPMTRGMAHYGDMTKPNGTVSKWSLWSEDSLLSIGSKGSRPFHRLGRLGSIDRLGRFLPLTVLGGVDVLDRLPAIGRLALVGHVLPLDQSGSGHARTR